MVTGDLGDVDTGPAQALDRLGRRRPDQVRKDEEPEQGQVLDETGNQEPGQDR